jgi:uncharacterized protein (TIRG00374 family)
VTSSRENDLPSDNGLPTPASRSRLPFVTLGILLLLFLGGIFLLIYLLKDMDWELVRQTSPGTLVLIAVLSMLSILTYTVFVYLLVRDSGHKISLWKTYLLLTSSLSANYITLVKAGIPLRVYLYNRFVGIPPAIGTVLVTVETLVGLLVPALVAIISIALLFPSVGLIPPVILVALILLLLFIMLRLPVNRLLSHLRRLPFQRLTVRLARFAERVQSGLCQVSPMALLSAISLDLVIFGIQTWRLWLIIRIFGPTPSPLALLAVLTISLTIGNISMIPMGLGVRDVSSVWLLMQLAVPNQVAVSVAIIQRFFSLGWPLLLGVISSNILGIEILRIPAGDPQRKGSERR